MRQQTFEEILESFKEKMKGISEDTISDILGDYLPYAETDMVMNVEHRTRDWLEAFFNGKSIIEGKWHGNKSLPINKHHKKYDP